MPDNILTVDGVNLFTAYGAYAYEREVLHTSENDVTFYSVPARDGDVLGVNTRMKDIEISYDIVIIENGETNLQGLRNFLMSRKGRVRIEYSNDLNHYRQGVFIGPFKPKLSKDRTQAKGVVAFRCLPQRWLTSGETVITKSPGLSWPIDNPTAFNAKPLLRVYGYGTVDFDGYYTGTRIDIADYGLSYIDIDCETMNCYNDTTNLCEYVTFIYQATVAGVDAPVLHPGTNYVSLQGANVTSIEITPRWWEV